MATFTIDPHKHLTEAEVRKRCLELSRALFRLEEEMKCAHKWLDGRGIPRADDVSGEMFSLVGRMTWLQSATG